MPETIPEFIARAQAYCDAATKPPWYSSRYSVGTKPDPVGGWPTKPDVLFNQNDGEYVENPNAEKDGVFAAQSRTDLPRALKALEYIVPRYIGMLHPASGGGLHIEEKIIGHILSGGELNPASRSKIINDEEVGDAGSY